MSSVWLVIVPVWVHKAGGVWWTFALGSCIQPLELGCLYGLGLSKFHVFWVKTGEGRVCREWFQCT